jgi:hypothetical protein
VKGRKREGGIRDGFTYVDDLACAAYLPSDSEAIRQTRHFALQRRSDASKSRIEPFVTCLHCFLNKWMGVLRIVVEKQSTSVYT